MVADYLAHGWSRLSARRNGREKLRARGLFVCFQQSGGYLLCALPLLSHCCFHRFPRGYLRLLIHLLLLPKHVSHFFLCCSEVDSSPQSLSPLSCYPSPLHLGVCVFISRWWSSHVWMPNPVEWLTRDSVAWFVVTVFDGIILWLAFSSGSKVLWGFGEMVYTLLIRCVEIRTRPMVDRH